MKCTFSSSQSQSLNLRDRRRPPGTHLPNIIPSRPRTQPAIIPRTTPLRHKIKRQLPIRHIIVRREKIRHAAAVLAAVLQDPGRQALDVPQGRPARVLQVGADGRLLGEVARGVDAGDLLLVVEPAVVGPGLDVAVEAGGGVAVAPAAFAAAFAVDAFAGGCGREDGEEGGEGELHFGYLERESLEEWMRAGGFWVRSCLVKRAFAWFALLCLADGTFMRRRMAVL